MPFSQRLAADHSDAALDQFMPWNQAAAVGVRPSPTPRLLIGSLTVRTSDLGNHSLRVLNWDRFLDPSPNSDRRQLRSLALKVVAGRGQYRCVTALCGSG